MLANLRPLRVALLFSKRAPGIERLLTDSRRGTLFNVVCCVTTEDDFADRQAVESRGIVCVAHPIRRFHQQRGLAMRNLRAREEYDEATVGYLQPLQPDIIILSGYHWIVTEPLLRRFENRIVNLHNADLTQFDREGRRRHTGLHPVESAIFEGDRETRATVHIVTEHVAEGPLLVRSEVYPVSPLLIDALSWEAREIVEAYAFAHREWMVRSASGPMIMKTVEIFAQHTVQVIQNVAWVDGVGGPLQMPDSRYQLQPGRVAIPCPYLPAFNSNVPVKET